MRDTLDSADFPVPRGAALPERIDRYEIRGLLGRGGMGSVYLGFDERLGREVAVKVINAEAEMDQLRQRFHREARAVAMLRHPNIVEVLDYSGPDSRVMFLVMERLTGRTLDQLVARRPLTEAEAAALAYELCDALGHAHDKGMVHRDIKPENIFIEPSGRVVLTDFGIVKGVARDDEGTFAGQSTSIVGTPLFAAVEQLTRPNEVSARSDLFSVGAVLFNALSRRYPYPAESVSELLRAFAKPPVELRDVAPVSDELHFLVMRLLATDPEARPSAARDVQRAIRPILQRAKIFDLKAAVRGLHVAPAVAEPAPRPALATTTDRSVASGRVTEQVTAKVGSTAHNTIRISAERAPRRVAPAVVLGVALVALALVLLGAWWLRGPAPAPARALGEAPAVEPLPPLPTPP